jgi:hypothetical protein
VANARLNFVLTNGLDETVRRMFREYPATLATKPVSLAVLGSSTVTHLLPAIRVGGLRRGLWVETYESDFGQYRQELADPASALHAFAPTAILLALDAYHLTAGITAGMDTPAPMLRWPRCGRKFWIRGGWRGSRFAARSSSRRRSRCICRCWAATNIGCPGLARALSLG